MRASYRDRVRWQLLFEDLEAFAEATERAEFEADVADRSRAERAGLRLVDRLRGHLGDVVALRLVTRERLAARLTDVGSDWMLLDDDAASVLVPLAAVTGVEGLSRRAFVETGMLARRVRLTIALRRLARDRSAVRVRLIDGSEVCGTIDRAGSDHLDIALHAADEPRRPGLVRGVCVVPVTAIVQVRAAA